MYFDTFGQFKKTLKQLDAWLETAAAHAKSKSVAPATVLGLRLVVDQFPFVRQVQIACDTAKLGASRLTGKEAPAHVDTEQSFEELRARVASVLAYLDALTEADFADAATRQITQPRWEGRVMTGRDYFFEHVIPNFFFHATTAYAILRQNGFPLGKKDFLGPLTQRQP